MDIPTDEILEYWFKKSDDNQAFWFDKSQDKYIESKYKEYVDRFSELIADDKNIIAYILIGDQFTRNIYRNDKTKNDIYVLDKALDLINNNKDLSYPLVYRYFILLPLRHAKKSHLLDIVCMRIKLYNNNHKNLIKFYHITLTNYAELVDTIKIGQDRDSKDDSILEKYKPITNSKKISISVNNMAVSLSGGVDSMVLLDLMHKQNNNLIAIHIEYTNRKEARLEREFLEHYCYNKGIKLYYRTIDYIQREIDRELFERETRKARFNLYKYVMEKEGLKGVCLGHHMGDIVENVLTNMIKGRDLDSMNDNSITFRPFLKFNKDTIIEYAHSNNIPYFLNSTPSWSCRGVLRDQVIPILKKQFGDFEHNIINFLEKHKKVNNIIDFVKMDYCCKSMLDININCKELLLKVLHGCGYKMVSHKLLDLFTNWIKNPKTNIELGKNMFCYYRKGYLYFIDYYKILKENPDKTILLTMFDNYLPKKLK